MYYNSAVRFQRTWCSVPRKYVVAAEKARARTLLFAHNLAALETIVDERVFTCLTRARNSFVFFFRALCLFVFLFDDHNLRSFFGIRVGYNSVVLLFVLIFATKNNGIIIMTHFKIKRWMRTLSFSCRRHRCHYPRRYHYHPFCTQRIL